ncbi:MAG TPA: hypothetical protein VIT38_00370 [Allosphingosinicella sp.]|jgi:hypothetical protein
MPKTLRSLILPWAALAAAAPALAQGQAVPPASAPTSPSPFSQLWTPWTGVTRDSAEAEAAAARRRQVEAEAEATTSVPAAATRAVARRPEQGATLGERVGEMVRSGDCEGGERIAREAGDFPLVQAVRDHCRPRRPNP